MKGETIKGKVVRLVNVNSRNAPKCFAKNSKPKATITTAAKVNIQKERIMILSFFYALEGFQESETGEIGTDVYMESMLYHSNVKRLNCMGIDKIIPATSLLSDSSSYQIRLRELISEKDRFICQSE
jgi:hypothetical protein